MMLHFMFFSARKVVVGVCALIALFALGGCTSNDPLTILGPWSDECNCHSICFHSDGMFYYESDCDSTPYVFCAGRWKMKDDKVCLSSLDSLDFSISISGDNLLLRNGGYESRLIRSGSLSCGTHPVVVDDTLSVPMGVLKCNGLQGAVQDLLKQRNYYNVPNSHQNALTEYFKGLEIAKKLGEQEDIKKIRKRIEDMKLRMSPEEFADIEKKYERI